MVKPSENSLFSKHHLDLWVLATTDPSPSSTERTLSNFIYFFVVGMSGQWYKFIAACQLSGICWLSTGKWVAVFKYLSANMTKDMNISLGFAMTFSFALKSCLPLIKKLIRLLKLAVHLYHCTREIHSSFWQSLCRIPPSFLPRSLCLQMVILSPWLFALKVTADWATLVVSNHIWQSWTSLEAQNTEFYNGPQAHSSWKQAEGVKSSHSFAGIKKRVFSDSTQGMHAPEFSWDGEGTSRNKLVKWIFSDTATISGSENGVVVCSVT